MVSNKALMLLSETLTTKGIKIKEVDNLNDVEKQWLKGV